jgi:type IV pilus assembly protein PilQ
VATAPARKPARPAPPVLAPGTVLVLDTPQPARWRGEPISLDLKDADIRDVLKAFAKIGRFNLAVDPEVRGSVTVRLENVPWDQALDVILRMNALGSVLEGRILRVGTPSKL